MTDKCEDCGHFYAYTGKELCKVTDPEEKGYHAFTQKGWGLCLRFKNKANEMATKYLESGKHLEEDAETAEDIKEKAVKLKIPMHASMTCIDYIKVV